MADSHAAWFSVCVNGAVRGYHIYGTTWNPYVGEQLTTVPETANREDKYAVAVKQNGDDESDAVTVGHIPREISKLSSFFIRRGGLISCEVTGDKRRSNNYLEYMYCRHIMQFAIDLSSKFTYDDIGSY